jgi:hypothetical protein
MALPPVMLMACALTSGCGGSPKPLTRAQLLAQGDAICRRVNKKLSATTIKTQKEFVRVLPRLSGYEQQGLAQLSKLIPPAAMADDWKAIVAGAQTLADDTAKLGALVKAKDLKATHAVVADIAKVGQRTAAIARREGFKNCSQLA